MLHYHGTPITKRDPHLEKLRGRHFCVSFAHPYDASWCIEHAQSIMWDNGAFTAYTKGKRFNMRKYIQWLDDKLYGANWAVVPDVIGGSVEQQKEYILGWPYPDHLSCYVWHMDLPLTWLEELCRQRPNIAFGSSGKYWKVLSPEWKERADSAWEIIDKVGNRNRVHMMRGLKVCGHRWPFASADSSNIARNHGSHKVKKCTREMADRIDSVQSPLKFYKEHDE